MEDLINKIKEDIKKTGFVSELNTISKLLNNDWDAEHSIIYEDKDEKKSREIDIIGSNLFQDKEINFDIDIILIIEVKKSDKPWIIFTSEFDKKYWKPEIMINGYNIHKWTEVFWGNSEESSFMEPSSSLERFEILDHSFLSILTHPEGHNRIGKAFHEFSKKANEPSQIYSSLIGLSKATVFFDEMNYPDKSQDSDFNPLLKKTLSIYLPVIVLDGILFEVFNSSDGELNILQKNVIPVDSTIISKNYGGSRTGLRLTHTIVTYNGLDEYIKQLNEKLLFLLENYSFQIRKIMES